jgi:hypothetical protein
LAEGKVRMTDWSEPSPAASIPANYRVLAREVKPAVGANEAKAKILCIQWVPNKGVEVPREFGDKGTVDLYRGTLLNFPDTDALIPIPGKSETVDGMVSFLTNVMLVDLDGGEEITVPKPGGAAGNRIRSPSQMIFMDPSGELFIRNSATDYAEYNARKRGQPAVPMAPPTGAAAPQTGPVGAPPLAIAPFGAPQARAHSEARADIVPSPMQPTVVGVAPEQRVGFPNPIEAVFDSDRPRFIIPRTIVSAGAMNITRLYLCRKDLVKPEGDSKVWQPRDVNLWVPVKGGPCAQAVPRGNDRTKASVELQPTRPLPDGVYCLHSGILADSKPVPEFCSPFMVRGYGVPKIQKTSVKTEAADAKLMLVIRNDGLGEFNDGFLVATVQKKEASGDKFSGRRHVDIPAVPVKGERLVEVIWNTADLEPGTYCFYGHINYHELWDINTLAEFESDTFEVKGSK